MRTPSSLRGRAVPRPELPGRSARCPRIRGWPRGTSGSRSRRGWPPDRGNRPDIERTASTWYCSVAPTVRPPAGSRSRCRSARSMPRSRRGSRAEALEGLDLPGKRRSPFSRPWVRLAAQKPPLRPDAAQPMRSPSSSTTSRSGSRSLARIAVHRPEKPPPTMASSVDASAPRAARAGGRDEESSQNEVGRASRKLAAASGVTGAVSLVRA